jgi:SPP1 family predicted phage head-tail adaptor
MRAGSLRHQLVFYERAGSTDEGGGASFTLAPVLTLWASLKQLSESRIAYLRQSGLSATHEARLRYTSAIHEQMVVGFGSRRFTIESIENVDERGFELVLRLAELGPASEKNV